jgi:ABC-type transport system involved in multi-copper enzyme maturation permease subunit
MSSSRTSQLILLAGYHLRYSLRSGSAIIFALLTLMVGLTVTQLFFTSLSAAQAAAEKSSGLKMKQEEILEVAVTDMGPAVKRLLGNDAAFSAHLLHGRPALLSGIFLVILFSVGLLVPLGAFNQVSGDLQHKGLRYLLTRTDRSSIFFGRFVSTYLYCSVILVILAFAIGAYTLWTTDIYSGLTVLRFCLEVGMASSLLALPYVALCAWISGMIASPILSLTASNFVVIIIPIVSKIAESYWAPGKYLSWVLPWGIKFHLLHPHWTQKTGAAVIALLYTFIYLGIGYWLFRKRDL